jgi:3-deoxy-D-manno-octulosonic-acid transferase
MMLYNAGIIFYYAAIRLAALFNHKAKLWVAGRRNIFTRIEAELTQKIHAGDKVLWFHCASLGEFEQGRPVIENLKKRGYKIVLTFFSPSGYEIRKNYEHADAVFYLPIDTPSNAKKFVELVRPQAALFVKYEFWLNYLAALRQNSIPAYLVSGVFRPNQHFFKWYGRNFFYAIKNFKILFVQDENSLALLKQHAFTNAQLAGDTRFDRVVEIARNKKDFPSVKRFCGEAKVIVAGSTWPKDEELLLKVYTRLKETEKELKMILVPHEVDAASMNGTISQLENSTLTYGKFTENNFEEKQVLVIDTIGMLSQIYQYATVAYIGGGFNDGIHNILEVFAHDVPVAFGPNYHKFVEAHEAEKDGTGKPVHSEADLFAHFSRLLSDTNRRASIKESIHQYMQRKTGATEIICSTFN